MFYHPMKDSGAIVEAIKHQKYLSICINDSEYVTYQDFENAKKCIIEAFDKALHEKSVFEK